MSFKMICPNSALLLCTVHSAAFILLPDAGEQKENMKITTQEAFFFFVTVQVHHL